MSKASQAGPWAQVNLFRTYKDAINETQPRDARVFRNGRQQCRIRVVIEVQDANGNNVDLPETDFQNIELIDYSSGEPLPAGWLTSRQQNEYEWDESIIPGAQSGSPEDRLEIAEDEAAESLLDKKGPRNRRVATFYVATTVTGSTQIAARIALPRGGYAKTNDHWISDPDGLGNGAGNFNSSVRVVPTAFPALPVSSYADLDTNGNLMGYRVGNNNNFYVATEHYIFVSLSGRYIPLKSVSGNPLNPAGFAVYKEGDYHDAAKWGFSYCGQPNSSAASYLPFPPFRYFVLTVSNDDRSTQTSDPLQSTRYEPTAMFNSAVGQIVGRSDKRVVIGLITGNLHGRLADSNGSKVADVESTTLYIRDAFGNDHALNLYLGTRANQLRIVVARSGEDQSEDASREDPKPDRSESKT